MQNIPNMTDINSFKKIHFIGIGGCSMSGLALLFKNKGFYVQGSDVKESPFTKCLEKEGVNVFIGHRAENLGDCDLVVYSAAIKPDNVERKEAERRGITSYERSCALGILSGEYKTVVGVSGCHGKTTITSMLALINKEAQLDATVHVGGFVDFLGCGVHPGGHDRFITEACEYVESFLTLKPTMIILNNIDDDHLDYYKDIEHIENAFRKFIGLMPKGGLLIACTDDERVKRLYNEFDGRKVSYGMKDADFMPVNIAFDENGYASYELIHNGESLGSFKLSLIGAFNCLNATAATIAAIELGAEVEPIRQALSDFRPAKRRFEYYGEKDGHVIYHDYAHHPGEIKAVLDGAKRFPHRKMFAIFQCNSFTRAKELFCKELDCFNSADEVLVPDIYPGRDIDDGTVHARDMVEWIRKGGVDAKYIPTFEEISAYLDEHAHPGDLVITLGSGDVMEKTKLLL